MVVNRVYLDSDMPERNVTSAGYSTPNYEAGSQRGECDSEYE